MPLQYPLLFPYGETGWSTRLKLRTAAGQPGRSMTVNTYYSYVLHSRCSLYSLLLRGSRLFQQFLVDSYMCVEGRRLEFARTHQNQLRSEYVAGIYDAVSKGDSEGKHIGKRMFLPSTFVGGPRYMYKHYQDALALCRVYGNPQYFITFTCNVRWPEIVRFMDSEGVGHAQDRPDIIARVFQMKVCQFINFLKEDKPFGSVSAYLYTIEFQKRGLPHCHTLLWVETTSKIRTPADVDKYITAELPDPVMEPLLYATVTNCMIHGPCDLLNSSAPCMRDGTFKKKFPKPFSSKTFFVKDGVERVSFALHKADIVGESNSTSTLDSVNEIQNFLDGRFVCLHEGAWRILNFSIHERQPAVQILSVHLENMQNVTFDDNAALQEMVENVNFGKTTLTRWLVNNRWDPDGRHLTYIEYPLLFRWDASAKEWICRSRNTGPPVGRLVYVHPTAGELFYLCMLLCHQKGCRTFTELRTVDGVVYSSFRLACEALGLVGDDREWLTAFVKASSWASSSELRSLFCHLLLFCEVTNPTVLWEHAWPKMGDDISRTLTDSLPAPQSTITEDMLKQHVLFEAEKLLNAATPTKSLTDFQLPLPSSAMLVPLQNRLLLEETMYDTLQLQNEHSETFGKLNPDQLRVYNKIRCDHELGRQTLLFVYGHGWTGKTFLWSTILAYFRSVGKVILAVAASGIASLLLPNGRTTHSRFNIPIDLSDTCMCHIKKRTRLSELLQKTTMVIWDEATMTDRRCFECVDRSFRDILGERSKLFGGMSMLLGGDFRQTLPVKRKKSHQDVMASTLPNSYLWPYFTVYKLSFYMRLSTASASDSVATSPDQFAGWLLDIGNGLLGTPDLAHPESTFFIRIPDRYLVMDDQRGLQQLIDFVYTSGVLTNPTPESLRNRAIVCPKNTTTDEINRIVLDMAYGQIRTYSSNDSITPHTSQMSDLELLYPQEYLNQLTFPGLPLHSSYS